MANVCLLLEGTYPYVSGGVSSCVHQLISKLTNISFQLVYIGTKPEDTLEMKYVLPPNVVGLQELYLFDEIPNSNREVPLTHKQMNAVNALHKALHEGDFFVESFPIFMKDLFPLFPDNQKFFASLASKELWNLLRSDYEKFDPNIPFVEFFYTWRSAHIPIYRVLSYQFPKADVYHSLSTGYAGLAAMRASLSYDIPFLITEHGIYAHEREMEISEADWIFSDEDSGSSYGHKGSLKKWWIDLFRNMSKLPYSFAAEIITLYRANSERQIKDGAPPERTKIIPNGINNRLYELRRKEKSWAGAESNKTFNIVFVGRIVPIKDVKTLIKAIRAIKDEYDNIRCQLIGPNDEDEEYFADCMELIEFLNLKDSIEFLGFKNVADVYPYADCLLLTSISEAQPLVLLEANSAGVPCVATDVGSCRELLQGKDEADSMIGQSGLLADMGDTEQIAARVLKLIRSPKLWEEMSLAGMTRVKTYYEEETLMARYDQIYKDYMSRAYR